MREPDVKPTSGYYPGRGADERRAPERKPPRMARRRVRPLRLLALAACAAVFVYCAWQLAYYFGDIAGTRRSTAELGALYEAEQPTATVQATEAAQTTEAAQPTAARAAAAAAPSPSPFAPAPTATPDPSDVRALWPAAYPGNPRLRVSERFLDLLEKNHDIVGWLTIEGLVDEPVVQRDNSFYLTHNASGRKSVTGALFLDENCSLRDVSPQMLIHGHNMKEGAMFGSLKLYKVKSAAYYKRHPYITFNTLYEDARYVIFAALETDVRPSDKSYLAYWTYDRFSSAEEFDAYIDGIRALSHYRCNVDVRPGDRLLTLSTCSGSDDNKRFLVVARRVRDGEDLLALDTMILTTSDR